MIGYPLTAFVRIIATLTDLSDNDSREILSLPHRVKVVEPNAYVVREDDKPWACSILISGYAYRQKLTSKGSRQIVALHMPGDPLDFQHLYLSHADHDVRALTEANVATIPRQAIIQLLQARPHIAAAVMAGMLVEASIIREWLLSMGRRDARTRLAHLLCEIGIRLEARGLAESDEYRLPMNQQQLGDVLGLTAVHINRMLKELEREGYLIRKARGRALKFPNMKALQNLAGFSGRYLYLGNAIDQTGVRREVSSSSPTALAG